MTFVDDSRAQSVSRTLLVVLRVYLGSVFLVAVWGKLGGGFAPRLTGFIERLAMQRAHDFYKPFLEGVVLPNAETFAFLITLGELLIAIGLLTGTATRLAAGVAVFITLNYMLAKGNWFWTPSSNDAAFVFIGLVVLVGAAGRAFGVDYYLAKKWPKVPLW